MNESLIAEIMKAYQAGKIDSAWLDKIYHRVMAMQEEMREAQIRMEKLVGESNKIENQLRRKIGK